MSKRAGNKRSLYLFLGVAAGLAGSSIATGAPLYVMGTKDPSDAEKRNASIAAATALPIGLAAAAGFLASSFNAANVQALATGAATRPGLTVDESVEICGKAESSWALGQGALTMKTMEQLSQPATPPPGPSPSGKAPAATALPTEPADAGITGP